MAPKVPIVYSLFIGTVLLKFGYHLSLFLFVFVFENQSAVGNVIHQLNKNNRPNDPRSHLWSGWDLSSHLGPLAHWARIAPQSHADLTQFFKFYCTIFPASIALVLHKYCPKGTNCLFIVHWYNVTLSLVTTWAFFVCFLFLKIENQSAVGGVIHQLKKKK